MIDNWRSIITAPTDGKIILVAYVNLPNTTTAYWNDEESCWINSDTWLGLNWMKYNTPTAWQVLPVNIFYKEN